MGMGISLDNPQLNQGIDPRLAAMINLVIQQKFDAFMHGRNAPIGASTMANKIPFIKGGNVPGRGGAGGGGAPGGNLPGSSGGPYDPTKLAPGTPGGPPGNPRVPGQGGGGGTSPSDQAPGGGGGSLAPTFAAGGFDVTKGQVMGGQTAPPMDTGSSVSPVTATAAGGNIGPVVQTGTHSWSNITPGDKAKPSDQQDFISGIKKYLQTGTDNPLGAFSDMGASTLGAS